MPASRWTLCLAEILKHEGGYADHPSDPGGATNMGITHKTLARWRGIDPWWDLPKTEIQGLARSEASAIYKALYWERCKAAPCRSVWTSRFSIMRSIPDPIGRCGCCRRWWM